MFVIYIALLTWLADKSQTTTQFPLNAAIVVGQTVTFNCRTKSHNSFWWRYIAVGSKIDSILFNGINTTEYECDSCAVNNTEPGQYDLQITNTRQSDAGTYICVVTEEISTNANISRAENHAAQLIVLASVPKCDSNLTGSNASLLKNKDSVHMWCTIGYRGNIAPTMEWRNKATDEIVPSQTTRYENIKVDSEIIVQLTSDNNRDDIAYSCTTYFNQSFYYSFTTNYSDAKNTPDYIYTWTCQNVSRKLQQCYGAFMSNSSQESSTETIGSPTNNEFFAVWSITIVVIILLVILVFCIVFLKLSSKGCFKTSSSAGLSTFPHANTDGFSNIFYEDPHANVTSPINGDTADHTIRVFYADSGETPNLSSSEPRENAQMPDRDHVYSLEPAQKSTQQHKRLQDETLSVTTGAWTHTTNNVGGGELGSYEDVVDILRNISHSEERHAAINEGIHAPRPTFNVGTDGTIYTQVQLGRGGNICPTTSQPRTIQPLFSTSVYAPIDHTTRIVPMPPTTRRQSIANNGAL